MTSVIGTYAKFSEHVSLVLQKVTDHASTLLSSLLASPSEATIHALPDWASTPEVFWAAVDSDESATPICYLLLGNGSHPRPELTYQSFLHKAFIRRQLAFSAFLYKNIFYVLLSQRPTGCYLRSQYFLSAAEGGTRRAHLNGSIIKQAYASTYSHKPILLSMTYA